MPISIGLPLGSGGKAVPPDAKIRPSAPDILWAAGVPTISKIITVPAAGAMAFSVTAPTISGAGPSFAIRDQYTTTINPVVDAAAEPGPGTRDATGSLWKIISGRLRGGMQPSAPAWGSSKIVYDGQTRVDGLTLWTTVIAANIEADLGVGWASATGVTDPTTNGHHWLMNGGYPRISQPSKLVTISTLNTDDTGIFRPIEYLVGVTIRAQGAFYWISAVEATGTTTTYSSDPIGIPQYPSARILWVEDTTTTTPMYPHITALDLIGPTTGHAIDDLRVNVITDWATDAGMASFLDRFTRADSTTSVGSGWTTSGGVAGVISNQAYIVSNTGTRTFARYPGAASSGDGIWRWRMTVGSTTANQIECHFRFVDTSNYCLVYFSGGSVWLVSINGGSGTTIGNYPFALSVGQVIDVCVVTKGSNQKLFINDDLLVYGTDGGGTQQTGTAIGFGSWAVAPAGARWDDMMAIPNTITLPTAIQTGDTPHIFTPGSTIVDDTFSGTNGAAISGRTPDTTGAGTWSVNGTGWTIQSNTAQNSNIAGSTAYHAYYDCGSADVEATLAYITPSSGAQGDGVVLRFTDSSNWLGVRCLGNVGGADQEIEIEEAVAGSPVVVKFQQLRNYHAASSAHTMKCQLVGDLLHVFIDTIPILTYIVTVPSSTKHGIYHNSIGAVASHDRITIKALT